MGREGMNSGMKPTISLCMIVKNEEDFIAHCLESVREVVDEIVVVDTGSEDATPEIVLRFGAKIIEHEWRDDFSEARNVSLSHATSQWILFLDADEVLEYESARRLPHLLLQVKPSHFGCFFCIYNVKEDGMVSGRHYNVRLFRRWEGVRFVGSIHEQVFPMGPFVYSGMNIYHFGYDLNPERMREKNERNVYLLTHALEGRGDDPVVHYHLANLYLLRGEYEQAMVHAHRGLELTAKVKRENYLYLAILQVLIEVYYQRSEWDAAEEWCERALEIRDDFIDALYSLARVYIKKNSYRKALLTYYRFLERKRLIDADPARGFFYRCLTSWGKEAEVHNDLGGIFYEHGNWERAIEEAQKVIDLVPHDARGYYNLGSALAAKGEIKGAEEGFKKALEIKPTYREAEESLERLRVV
jgi:glycosyltransferase involved in cell wall biosynthesis